MKKKLGAKTVAQAAMIAAIYVVLTFVFQPISFGSMQCRVSEILTILPVFTPAAIPGLFVGCLLGNIFGGAMLLDIILGSLTTLVAAVGTYMLRERRILAALSPILLNGIVVGSYIPFLYSPEIPVWLSMIYVAAGQIVSCGVGGLLFACLLDKTGVFKKDGE